jgi:hypothetical protein
MGASEPSAGEETMVGINVTPLAPAAPAAAKVGALLTSGETSDSADPAPRIAGGGGLWCSRARVSLEQAL